MTQKVEGNTALVEATPAFGIDLGTTYSAVAQVGAAGFASVLPNAEGSPTTPSVVLFDGDHVVVGAVAREALATEPEVVVQLVKRRMGSSWEFDYRGISYRAEHVSALILKKLLADAQLLAGPGVEAAITVPAYFNDAMRMATRSAGAMAGIDVLGLLSEPTAAAIAFGYDRRPEFARGIVVDLGGGTFDVTVMEFEGSDLTVRGTGGDAYLGGANFDKIVFDYFVEQFLHQHAIDISDPDTLSIEDFTQVSQDWLQRADRAKHDLSSRERTAVSLQAAGMTHRLDLTRDTFERLSAVLLDEMSEKMLDVIQTAGLAVGDVKVVIPVGGSTRIPMVRERIRRVLGANLDTSVRPDEAVALGAALYAAQIQLEKGHALTMDPGARDYLESMTVTDVSAHTLGVSVFDAKGPSGARAVMQPILERNTALPFTESKTFFTMNPGETRIIIPILEGEAPEPDLCARIGEVIIENLPPGRPSHQPVVVTMKYDRDGILEVSALDENSGLAVTTSIERDGLIVHGESPATTAVRLAIVH